MAKAPAAGGPPANASRSPAGATHLVDVDASALAVVKQWENDAEQAESSISSGNDTKAQELLQKTQIGLLHMRKAITAGAPQRVFAFTTGEGVEGIQAIAIMTEGFSEDHGYALLEIKDIIAKPTANGTAAKESIRGLVHRINYWAAVQVIGIAGPHGKDMSEYYKVIGLGMPELDALVSPRTRVGKMGGLATLGLQTYELQRVPHEAAAVLRMWLRDATVATMSIADNQTQHLMQHNQDACFLMLRTIAEGTASHVLAVTTGEGVEDIRALATVSRQVGVDNVTGLKKDVVGILEIVAKPTGESRTPVSALVRGIHEWAVGRTVVVSKAPALQAYYSAIGFNPLNMDRAARSEGKLRMVALEPGSGYHAQLSEWLRTLI